MKLILASTSPRRRELLQQLDIPFEIIPPRFEEIATDLTPDEEALLFAREKARSIAAECPDSLILASDTLVACEGHKLGKPQDATDACRMLEQLSAKTHQIFTAIVLLDTTAHAIKTHVERVDVTFRELSPQEIAAYVATGEPLDKAGAYAIQGGAKDFATAIRGDLDAVIGLPLAKLRDWLMA